MSKFGGKNPRGFFTGASVSSPADKVEEFAGSEMVIDFGVKDLRDFKFWFIVNCYWQRQGLNTFGDWFGNAGSNIERWNMGCTAQRLSGS